MPRPLVEAAGPAWHAGSLQRRCLFIGSRKGAVRVGDRVLTWQLASDPFGVVVSEWERRGKPLRVGIVSTALPSGGRRWWFSCPECGRRCDLLYLRPGGIKLACRRCCGFAYASQRSRAAGRPRTRRPRSTVTVTRDVKHSIKWGVPCKETTITLTDSSQPGSG